MQVKYSICFLLFLGLAGCASLPSNGPTGKQIIRSAGSRETERAPIRVIEIGAVGDMPIANQELVPPPAALAETPPQPTDLIGPGDVLDINIYEAGVTLFSAATNNGTIAATPGVQAQKLPPSRVDDNGRISIPYAGTLPVAGHTIGEVEAMIRQSLRRLSQNPQVLVTLSQAITNSIIIGGEVSKPGRLVLQTNRETLSDVIALAGGYRGNARDLTLRITRGGDSTDVRVNDLADKPSLDVRAQPGDRLMLINNPRTFSVLGASGRVEQISFAHSAVSLTEAIATAGGVNPNLGDPAAIFLFRYIKDDDSREIPVVYHLNMMKVGSYFLAQRFAMQDKDVLYFGNASANQPSKLVQLVSQLFSPVLTVTSAVQVLQNSSR